MKSLLALLLLVSSTTFAATITCEVDTDFNPNNTKRVEFMIADSFENYTFEQPEETFAKNDIYFQIGHTHPSYDATTNQLKSVPMVFIVNVDGRFDTIFLSLNKETLVFNWGSRFFNIVCDFK